MPVKPDDIRRQGRIKFTECSGPELLMDTLLLWNIVRCGNGLFSFQDG